MNAPKLLWPAIVGLAFISGTAWQVAIGQAPTAKPAQKWEYTKARFTADLEKMGDEGWELVAAAGPGDNFTMLYFKRPK